MSVSEYIIRGYQHEIGKYIILLSFVLIIVIGVVGKELYNSFQLIIKVFRYNQQVIYQQKEYSQRVRQHYEQQERQRQAHQQGEHIANQATPVYDNLLKVPKCYRALGLNKMPETMNEIKQVYRKRIKKLHPDVGGDPEEFKKYQELYEEAVSYWKVHNPK